MSQRTQHLVTQLGDAPFDVIVPGKRPRVTRTPSLALARPRSPSLALARPRSPSRDGAPWMAFRVHGGDAPHRKRRQFRLDTVNSGMTPQEAAEAAEAAEAVTMDSPQMRASLRAHESCPGHMQVAQLVPEWARGAAAPAYTLEVQRLT